MFPIRTKKIDLYDEGIIKADVYAYRAGAIQDAVTGLRQQIESVIGGNDNNGMLQTFAFIATYCKTMEFNIPEDAPDEFHELPKFWKKIKEGEYLDAWNIMNTSIPIYVMNNIVDNMVSKAFTVYKPKREKQDAKDSE